MTNVFLPKLNPNKAMERYRKASRAGRKSIGSNYVIHIAEDGSQQVLFMKFQDMPEEIQDGLEITVNLSGPTLFGMGEEFDKIPKTRRKGAHGGDKPHGSVFIVQATAYDVKDVDPHHLGGVTIRLIRSKTCDIKEIQFCEDVRPYICLPENNCAEQR